MSVRGNKLDRIGLLIDFHELKSILKDILSVLDHKNLNDIPPFDRINPSSESIARYIAEQASVKIGTERVGIESVTVWESDSSRCTYIP